MLSVAWLQRRSRRSVGLLVGGGQSFQGSNRLCRLFVVLGMAVLVAGCGETYRPVVTPVAVTGPAPQPQSYVVVTTTTGDSTPGLANIFDASGDTLLTQALIGNGPLSLSLSSSGTSATAVGTDGTVNTFTPSTTLQTKNVQISTLLQPAHADQSALHHQLSFHHRTQRSGGGGADHQFKRSLPAHPGTPGPSQPDQPRRQRQRRPRLLHHPGQRLQHRSLSGIARILCRSRRPARCSRSRSRR